MGKYDQRYLRFAQAAALDSTSKRLQVGCVVVVDNQVRSDGHNGTPAGCWTNVCEETDGTTSWHVIHAEMNAICKAARYGSALDGGTLYTTHSPCTNCAKHIAACGIKRVVYGDTYRDKTGLQGLQTLGVVVERLEV